MSNLQRARSRLKKWRHRQDFLPFWSRTRSHRAALSFPLYRFLFWIGGLLAAFAVGSFLGG